MLLLPATRAAAQETQIVYLSGQGAGSEVSWQFRLEAGRGAGSWTRIQVPAHWEQQGFGTYNYGHDKKKTPDVGFYRHSFEADVSWRGKRVELVFEGVMTDTLVKVNGQQAGPLHQGGFTRFSFDISPLLHYGAANLLEVLVHETSADASVEAAERRADYWVFGGIYRPVYLRISPPESIESWPIAAQADGSFDIPVRLHGLAAPAELELSVETLDGRQVGPPLRQPAAGQATSDTAVLQGHVAGIRPWNAEEPTLYRARLELTRSGKVLHRVEKRFGFRTLERRAEGLFLNGQRILLKGVNRHVFYPDTGRTSNAERDRSDAELLKALHFNAVRTSHYPPDVAFLDACDELGLYVIDELPGWHEAYDTAPGRKLVAEMVGRDADHPSILFWANGNEGGHNFDLDKDFALLDPQQRPVLHPQKVFSGFDTFHYPNWVELIERLDPSSLRNRWRGLFGEAPLFLPTEFQHGLYDGGGGASLADFWRAIRASPLGVGGFIWDFTDEAIARSDRGSELDTDGNHAPDGILGPWREPSGSSDAVAEVFAPVAFLDPPSSGQGLRDWDGHLLLENRFDFLDLSRCRLTWRTFSWQDFPQPERELKSGSLALPATPPGRQASLDLAALPWREADLLELRVIGPDGRLAGRRVFAVKAQRGEAWSHLEGGAESPRLERAGERVFLRDGKLALELDAASGDLVAIWDERARLPLAAPLPSSQVLAGKGPAKPESLHFFERLGPRPAVGVDLRYENPQASFSWLLLGKGWVRFSWLLRAEGDPLPGVFFPLAAERLRAFSFAGIGPARVWRNRLEGELGVYRKIRPEVSPLELGHEPIFEGTYGPVRRVELELAEGRLEMLLEEPAYLGMMPPRFPADAEAARADFLPREGFSLLHDLAAIGNKFDPAEDLGPEGAAAPREGLLAGTLWLRFVRQQ